MYRKDILDRKDDILRWIQDERSKAWMAKELQCQHLTLERALQCLKITYSGNIGSRGFKQSNNKKDASAYFDNSQMIHAHKLKSKLIEDGYKKHECESCGLSEWMDGLIPIELHHIDGNKHNNCVDNLEWCTNSYNHEHATKTGLKAKGVLMGSISLSKKGINLRYDIDEPVKKDIGRIIGADQGMVDVLTMSDAQVTLQTDIHGHSLKSILNRLVNKKKGSKSFKRTQDQRTNFINWSINRLDFSGIKQINLERIVNIGYKNGSSRLLSHWTNTVIRDKIEKRTMLEGVLLIEQDSTYRSQRCHCCSMVRKANRKGKTYSCNSCGFIGDADLNAAMNHEINIPEIPYTLRIAKYNRAGFYWTKDGFYDLAGSSLESLPHV